MRANAIEAAEQCGVLALPDIDEPLPLMKAVGALDPARLLVFCDEGADSADPARILAKQLQNSAVPGTGQGPDNAVRPPLAVLIGPEGCIAEAERSALARRPNTARIALGPRILRADTAAVAALALVQSVLGDWR
jgi:16S rRNA (uracil1498-N3)-methyltransferase